MKYYEISYNCASDNRVYNVNVRESDEAYFIDFQTGIGEAEYPKDGFTLDEALRDQAHVYDENPDASGDSWQVVEENDLPATGQIVYDTEKDEALAKQHGLELVSFDKGNYNQGDNLVFNIDGDTRADTGEFWVDKEGWLHESVTADNGDEINFKIPYLEF